MAGFTPDYLFPTVILPGQTHRFAFGGSLSQYQIANLFQPTINNSSQNCFELLNGNSSGFRFRQVTMSSNIAGSLIIENFINGSIPGSPLLTFNENGPLVLSPSGTNAVQLKNNSAVTPLQFFNSSGTFYAALLAGNVTSNVSWTLPLNDSVGTQALVSNGAGILSFATFGVGNVTNVSGTLNRISVANGTTTPVIDIDAAYIGQSSITTLGTITIGKWNASIIDLTEGGTNANLTPSAGGIVYSTASALAILGTANNGVLVTDGSGNPSISSILPTVVQTNITSLGTITTGIWNGTPIPTRYGGTGTTAFNDNGVICGGIISTGTLQSTTPGAVGQLLTSNGLSAIPSFQTYAGSTSITTLGTITTGVWHASIIDLPYGGTNAALTASAGGIVYSTASALAIAPGTISINKVLLSTILGAPVWSSLSYPTSAIAGQLIFASSPISLDALATANNGILVTSPTGTPSILGGTGTANQIILSGSSATPTWSTAIYPATTTINQLLYSSAANTITGLATANSSTLMTNGSGVPAWQTTSSNFVTSLTGTSLQITVSASTGAVTLSLPSDVVITSSVTGGNIMLIGNNIRSHNADGNINLIPNGAGITSFTSNVGFGTSTPNSAIQTSNTITNRVITLYEQNNNVHEFYGFGINAGVLRYQVFAGASHVWYVSASSTTSTELMRCNVTGLGVGSISPSYTGDFNGTLRAKKLIGNANAPTATLGITGIVGTGATSSVVGSELGGTFTLNTGTGLLTTGTVATFTLSSAMPSSTFSVVFTAANSNAAGQMANLSFVATSSSNFRISNTGLLGLAASTSYIWNFQIVGY
jgi:hypothetical protein